MARKPIVALVGRPNVGKSTLFNRLVGERKAVTHDIPGTTRDRLQGETFWNGIDFHIVDTGGIEIYQPKGVRDESPLAEGSKDFISEIKTQALIAIEEADAIIMLVDNQHGVTGADETIGEILRRTDKPVVVAANKADSRKGHEDALDFYSLGVGQVIPISAIHGLGVGDMLDVLIEHLREIISTFPNDDDDEEHMKIAIVGRPNAGKSTLLNKMIGQERMIVSPVAGTTRDAIDTTIQWHGEPVTIIDTAGIRRRGRVEPGVEQFSVIRAMDAIERSDVAILLIDGELGVTDQDEHIAGYVLDKYKSIVIVVNKWDAVTKDAFTMTEFTKNVRDRLHFIPWAPIIFISALTGQRIHQVLDTVYDVWQTRFARLPTSDFNEIIREALEHHAPPTKGQRRLKIFYGTQVRTNPPIFLLHINDRKLMHFTYERYLENRIRAEYPFIGTPIRISVRERRNKDQ
ncbi:MAG: ribosome biogenesis GTPase Der [Phototrophicaceae bacterium]